MKKFVAATAIAALAPLGHAVPLIDVELGASSWNASYSGEIGATNTNVDSLGFEDDTANSLYLTLELPVPLIPNIRLKTTNLEAVGTSTLALPFQFNNVPFAPNDTITTDIDLSHTDVTLYYGLPEFYLDVDFGLTLRVFDGDATAASAINAALRESVDLGFVIPMIFADVRLDLPFTGLYAGVEGNILSIGDNSLTDFNARIGYSTDIVPFLADLDIEAGFRSIDLELDSEDLDTDITIDGPYVGITLAF